MQLRRVILPAIVVASAGALTAVTIPALAGTDRFGGSSSPEATEAEPASEMFEAMQRDLGLTAEQAQARLEQEEWASDTVTALRDDLGDAYAGAWLDEDAEQLTVAVTSLAAATDVRAAGAQPEVVNYSADELDTVMSTLDSYDQPPAEVAGWYVEPASNQVVVVAPESAETAAATFADATGVPADAVRVEASDEQPQLLQQQDVRGGDPYVIENSSLCSIGFSVEGGFVTAGHCALAGTATTDIDGVPQGEFVAASFPGVGENGPDDWGVVAVNENFIPQPVVNDFQGGELPVAGSEEAPVGSSVCKFGNTTGVSCGTIQALDATVQYPEGTVTGLTRTDACAEPGDSGGAWLAGDQAQGMTSGGSGDCTAGGITFFQPVNEVLELGLTLVTTTGGDGAEEAEADGVEGGFGEAGETESSNQGW